MLQPGLLFLLLPLFCPLKATSAATFVVLRRLLLLGRLFLAPRQHLRAGGQGDELLGPHFPLELFMIAKELEAKILRLHKAEGWPVGTIAFQVGVHHKTVRRVLRQAGEITKRTYPPRPSMADPYIPFVKETLEEYPTIRASRLFEMVKQRGYPGGVDHFRTIVAKHRPKKPAEAYQRLTTLMGEQGQVDWGHFGHITIGEAKRPLNAFVMVLSWSRMLFLCFFLNQKMGSFLSGHVKAFSFFAGVPRVCLYDNLMTT